MSQLVTTATAQLRSALEQAMNRAMERGQLPQAPLPDFVLEVPADRSHGDWASNAAMVGARSFRMAPVKIAQAIQENLDLSGTYFQTCEIAGPGFLNFTYDPRFYGEVLQDIQRLGQEYGRSDYGQGKRVLVEFVSANPTGPMHIGNARGGVLGDALASVLDAAGYTVEREFYINDAGNQVNKFGVSLEARYLQLYKGKGLCLSRRTATKGRILSPTPRPSRSCMGTSMWTLRSRSGARPWWITPCPKTSKASTTTWPVTGWSTTTGLRNPPFTRTGL